MVFLFPETKRKYDRGRCSQSESFRPNSRMLEFDATARNNTAPFETDQLLIIRLSPCKLQGTDLVSFTHSVVLILVLPVFWARSRQNQVQITEFMPQVTVAQCLAVRSPNMIAPGQRRKHG